jgi:hypothetical protein
MNIYEKLNKIQTELKAPKGQYNSFGKYKYRSCEDILEAIKPFLTETKTVLTINDEIVFIGNRFYVKATAVLTDCENENSFIHNTAFAREDDSKKGMDGSQITGASSSYARKYALNGLFAIDDTKDADTDENAKQQGKTEQKQEPERITKEDVQLMRNLCEQKGLNPDSVFPKGIENLTVEQMKEAYHKIGKLKNAGDK